MTLIGKRKLWLLSTLLGASAGLCAAGGWTAQDQAPAQQPSVQEKTGAAGKATEGTKQAVEARLKAVEKPKAEDAPSNLAVTGRYVLPPAIFDCLARTTAGAGGEIQLTDGLRLLAQEAGLWAYIYEGVSYDAGDKLGFLIATVELALQNEELGAGFREYLKGLKL